MPTDPFAPTRDDPYRPQRGFADNPNDLTGLLRAAFGGRAPSVEQGPAAAALGLAQRLSQQEDSRHRDTLGFLTQRLNRADAQSQMAPTEMGQRFGRAADAATGQSLDQWGSLRDYLGGAGVTGGGLAAGMGSQIELGRMRQLIEAQRDLSIYEAERRSKAASDSFLRGLGLAEYMNQSPSMLLLDQLNSTADFNLNLGLGNAQIREAREARQSQERIAGQQFWSNIIGGGLGLLGGLL